MRHRSPFAFAGVLLILLLAVMGFAAFSATPTDTARTATGVVLPPTASGRIAGSVIGAQLATSVTPVPTTPTAEASVDSASESDSADIDGSESSTTVVDSSLAATTTQVTTTQPPTTTTTTTAPPTSTTAAPTTTTVPPTTTTIPPTTTTAPPTTTTTTPPENVAPPVEHPPAVEQWRDLVAAYWPAELVDDALTVIDCESNGDPNAVNPTSGASGLFQFLPSTWASAAPQAGWEDADVLDPDANVATAYWLFSQYADPWAAWSCKP